MNNSILRKMTELDLEMVRQWRNSDDVRRFMYTQHEISNEEHLNWWNTISKKSDNHQLIFEYKGSPCAVVSFSDLNTRNKSASWAFYLGDNAKRGVGSLIEFKALEYAFNELGLYKLKCEVLELNPTVIKLHKKFGFKEEGCLIDEYLYDSSYINVYRLAIFYKDWLEMKNIMKPKLERVWKNE